MLNGITGVEHSQVGVISATKNGWSGCDDGATDTFEYGMDPPLVSVLGVNVKCASSLGIFQFLRPVCGCEV